MSVGEREKGHEWIHWAYDYLRGYCACGECGSEKMMVHIGEWKEHISTAHPSAGQSDASLQQECREFVKKHAQDASNKSFYTDNADFFASLAGYLEIFIRTRLAESRAAMREECAKVVSEWRKTHFDISNKEDCIYEICADALEEAMEKFPADSSAIDARDARVRLEELLAIQQMRRCEWDDDDDMYLVERIAQLRRSAETGK